MERPPVDTPPIVGLPPPPRPQQPPPEQPPPTPPTPETPEPEPEGETPRTEEGGTPETPTEESSEPTAPETPRPPRPRVPGIDLSRLQERRRTGGRPVIVLDRLPRADVIAERLDSIRENARLRRVGVLVLQPVTLELRGEFDADDPCEEDAQNYAFEDWQEIDGCRLIFYPWPAEWKVDAGFVNQWRNLLAYEIFEREMQLGADEVLPWEEVGVPLALVSFDEKGALEFIDRFAVVRQGGRPKRRTPLVQNAGSPFVWQARIEQFAEQVADAPGDGADVTALAEQFRYLPPTGILPKEAINAQAGRTALRNNFFPASFEVEALPAPLEQLDAIVSACAALAPLDTADTVSHDNVRVVLPVPQEWYEPRLLITEEVDEIFQQAIDQFIEVRAERLQRRAFVRQRAAGLGEVINGQTTVFPSPDPDSLEPDESVRVGELDPPEKTQGFTNSGGIERTARLEAELRGIGPFMVKELERYGRDEVKKGLGGFINFLDAKVRRAEDKIDFGFLRAQTDIYRTRQLMLGTVAASRLATSPALASIAKGESAIATRDDLTSFLTRIKALEGVKAFEGPESSGPKEIARPTPNTLAKRLPDTETLHVPGETVEPKEVEAKGEAKATFASSIGRNIGRETLAAPVSRTPVRVERDPEPAFSIDRREREARQIILGESRIDTTLTRPPAGATKPPTTNEIVLNTPIIGKFYDFRTVTIAERIRESPAPEAKSYSVANKYEVLKEIAAFDPEKGDIDVDDLNVPGFYEYTGTTLKQENFSVFRGTQVIASRAVPIERKFTISEIRANDLKIAKEVLQGRHDLEPGDGDEAAFFSVGVRALDHTIAILRAVEGRVQSYRNAINICRAALSELQLLALDVNKRLRELDDDLAEARHDVAVARALLAEETLRIEGINQRRDRVVNEHVRFVLYYRPRSTMLLASAPVRELEPGLIQSPVPACLEHAVTAPDELRDMIDLLREAPVKWFTHIPALIDKLDRPYTIYEALLRARNRAALELESLTFARETEFRTNNLGRSINNAFMAQREVVARYRMRLTQLDLGAVAEQSWLAARDTARAAVSLGDLISDAGRGRAEIARRAADELEQIARIASCLYVQMSEVLPTIRLSWAERLSQYDEPVNLRNLGSLPRWGEIEFLDRRQMQALVDWLFQRVDVREAEAVTLMSEVVRVSILLASHAPVNQLIAGQLSQQTVVREGVRVDVTANLDRVRIGMHVLIYRGSNVVARAVVEDMAAGQASARVLKVSDTRPDGRPATTVELTQGARVQFAERRRF